MEKHGYKKYYDEDCVEWFVIEMSDKKSCEKHYFGYDIERNWNTTPEQKSGASKNDVRLANDCGFDENICYLYGKQFNKD